MFGAGAANSRRATAVGRGQGLRGTSKGAEMRPPPRADLFDRSNAGKVTQQLQAVKGKGAEGTRQTERNKGSTAGHPAGHSKVMCVAKSTVSKRRFEEAVANCSEYANDIDDYIFAMQKKFTVNEGFLHHCEVTPSMRSIVVEWLLEAHATFGYSTETFYESVALFDRYLSVSVVKKEELQCAGVTCMFVAAKYEEVFIADISEYEDATDNSVSRKEIICMERKILSALKCELGNASVILFIRGLTPHLSSQTIHAMAKLIGESAVCDYSTCHLLPSVIAAVAVWIAGVLQNTPFPDPDAFFQIARISRSEVHCLAPKFARGLLKVVCGKKSMALREKYSEKKNLCVAVMSPSQIDKLRLMDANDEQFIESLP